MKHTHLRWLWLPLLLILAAIWGSLQAALATSADQQAAVDRSEFSPAAQTSPTSSPPPGRGSLIGLITDAVTGQRLAGVSVLVGEQTALTNSAGVYRFDNVPAGLQTVVARLPGYLTAEQARQVVADQLRWNSISLTPGTDPVPTGTPTATITPSAPGMPDTGSLIGLITHTKTGERLAGVQVSIEGQVFQTGATGLYRFDGLSPGPHVVSAQHPNFEPATQTGLVLANEIRWNSIALTPRQQPAPTNSPTAPPSPPSTATPIPTETALPPPAATPTPAAPSTPTPGPTDSPTPAPSSTSTTTPTPTATAVAPPTVTPMPTESPVSTSTPANRTGRLIGLVTDSGTGERLAGVTVAVAGQSMVTDEMGLYRFDGVPAGPQVVTAEKEGYQPGQKVRVVVANEVRWNSIKLVRIVIGCPTQSGASFELIPVKPAAGEPRPDFLHGDLNLAQRGYSPTTASLTLQDYDGGADPNAPQLAGLFEPHRFPGIRAAYRVRHWDWACGDHGCPGPVITDWPTTLIGLATTPGQTIYLPERGPDIYRGEFHAVVLYAEEKRLTLGYTRDDSVAFGYAVHLESVCVDPNLLALYRAQNDEAGFRRSNLLPGLRNNQPLGTAFDHEIQVAIRDRGAFMDPRSRKDWWRGF